MSGWVAEFTIPDPEWDPEAFPKTHGRNPYKSSEFSVWMIEHFGILDFRKSAGTWRYTISDVFINRKMYRRVKFRDPNDAMLFKLRWL